METLLSTGLGPLHDGRSVRDDISSTSNESGDEPTYSVASSQLMEAEVALFWRTDLHVFTKEGTSKFISALITLEYAKGSDAAATMGAEAAVYAAEASDNNDLLERILPTSDSDYVDLVKVHIDAGSNHFFTSRQLLLLGTMFDFFDTTFRKAASLHRPLEHEIDEVGNEIAIWGW